MNQLFKLILSVKGITKLANSAQMPKNILDFSGKMSLTAGS
jgi:hypothetical protein